MKPNTMKFHLIASLAAICLCNLAASAGVALPEPGLVMYGAVLNTAAGNNLLTSGTLTWTITPPSGTPVTVSSVLSNIGGQFSYLVRVPFESIVGSATPSGTALILNSATTTYWRTNATLTLGTNTYPVTIPSAPGFFTFTTADRGKMEQVDLAVYAPGLGANPAPAAFNGAHHTAGGQFQMTVVGSTGQTYTLLTSTNLVNWVTNFEFTCPNAATTLTDPITTNSPRRFYRIQSQ